MQRIVRRAERRPRASASRPSGHATVLITVAVRWGIWPEVTEAKSPRDEMRRQIRSEIDEAFERIDVKLRDDGFALFLEAKTGDSEKGYENYLGMFEDSANLEVKAVQEKFDAVVSAERKGHKDYKLAISAQEIERIEKRLDAIRRGLPTDLFRGVFLVFRPMTESEWEDQNDRRTQHLRRLEQEAASGIEGLKREFQ